MSLLAALGWVAVGVVGVWALNNFWDQIAHWLNNTAANAVEKAFGPGARHHMHRAVATITRMRDMIRNTSVIYAKMHATDSHFQKTTQILEAPVERIDSNVIKEIQKQGKLEQEFEYRRE